MKEKIKLLPGLYYVGTDIPEGAYVFTPADTDYANITILHPACLQNSWYLQEPYSEVRIRMQKKMIFRLDRPVEIRTAETYEF